MFDVTKVDFTRPITRQICETVKKYNNLTGINHGTIDIVDWNDKTNEVTIKITDGEKSAVTTDTREAIHFSLKLLLCTATLINQAINTPNVAGIMD